MKQVLQITPILPGQAPDRRFSIPSRRSTASMSRVESHRSTNPPDSTAEEVEDEKRPEPDGATPLAETPGDGGDGGLEKVATEPGKPVRRLDSETSDVDVFQDAQS
jgi:hypothetical protein